MFSQSKVLVIDDDQSTLDILKFNLEKMGYACVISDKPKLTMDLAQKFDPDLFILDLIMPEISGIQLCHDIKANPLFKDRPVIFLTAAEQESDKLQAFESGAVDYIQKPFKVGELKVRIKNQLELYRNTKKLSELCNDMERLAEQRAKQLFHADRLATIGILAAGVAHEINNTTAFINGNVCTFDTFWKTIEPCLMANAGKDKEQDERLKFIINETPKLIECMKEGVKRISRIVEVLRAFYRKEEVAKIPFNLKKCIDMSLQMCGKMIRDRQITVKTEAKDTYVIGSAQQMEQVIVNLVVNGIDAMEKSQDPSLTVKLYSENNQAHVEVIDTGTGIPDDIIKKIWDPFFTTKETGKGTGLGLAIARSIVNDHGGEITVANCHGGGAKFKITLSLAK
ncbi:MAG TPA: response regulator [Candidatus Omnitrophota bacterium]|nr:response regulator [Candidatus Omnitrophota bacterium]HPS20105.1 response regulator [Candidatus Omnitrophota bacterium]